MAKVPPPPTRYGPGQTGQAKPLAPARPVIRPGYPPPPTHFGPRPAPQAKQAPMAAPLRTQAPPAVRYGPQACPHVGPAVKGTIQRMEGIEYFSKQVDQSVGKAINFGGQSLGEIVIREPRSFQGEEDAKFLRNLSTFFWFIGQQILDKDDPEVESMFVNDRILISANNPNSMRKIYEFMLENEEFNEFVRSNVETGSDRRGERTVQNFTDQMMDWDMSVNSALILQSSMLDKIDEFVTLAAIRRSGLTTDVITSGACRHKLILINGLALHAEQKLLLALVKSKVSTATAAIIRGKKRPCFGCWLCLTFAKEVLGYQNLDFNTRPGKAWKNAIASLKEFIQVANINNIDKKKLKSWAKEKIELHRNDEMETFISSGFGGKGQDQGYDTPSEDDEY